LPGSKFWTSDDVLDLDFIPKSVIVLGGGIVACELAQFLNRIGTRTTLVQRSRNILPRSFRRRLDVVQKAFVDEGIELFAGTKIQASNKRAQYNAHVLHDGKPSTRRAAHLFNALGASRTLPA